MSTTFSLYDHEEVKMQLFNNFYYQACRKENRCAVPCILFIFYCIIGMGLQLYRYTRVQQWRIVGQERVRNLEDSYTRASFGRGRYILHHIAPDPSSAVLTKGGAIYVQGVWGERRQWIGAERRR